MGNCNTCNCDGKGEATPNEFNVEDQAKHMRSQNKQGMENLKPISTSSTLDTGNGQKGGANKENRANNQSNAGGDKSNSSNIGKMNQKFQYSDAFIKKNVKLIVRLQALFRGNQARKYMSMLKSKQIGSSKYFTYEESRETITKKAVNLNGPREYRKPYKFRTGAVYTGQWIGGFRDGKGEQTWPDGAKYVGEWKENKAYGKGQFIHVDGDQYDG